MHVRLSIRLMGTKRAGVVEREANSSALAPAEPDHALYLELKFERTSVESRLSENF